MRTTSRSMFCCWVFLCLAISSHAAQIGTNVQLATTYEVMGVQECAHELVTMTGGSVDETMLELAMQIPAVYEHVENMCSYLQTHVHSFQVLLRQNGVFDRLQHRLANISQSNNTNIGQRLAQDLAKLDATRSSVAAPIAPFPTLVGTGSTQVLETNSTHALIQSGVKMGLDWYIFVLYFLLYFGVQVYALTTTTLGPASALLKKETLFVVGVAAGLLLLAAVAKRQPSLSESLTGDRGHALGIAIACALAFLPRLESLRAESKPNFRVAAATFASVFFALMVVMPADGVAGPGSHWFVHSLFVPVLLMYSAVLAFAGVGPKGKIRWVFFAAALACSLFIGIVQFAATRESKYEIIGAAQYALVGVVFVQLLVGALFHKRFVGYQRMRTNAGCARTLPLAVFQEPLLAMKTSTLAKDQSILKALTGTLLWDSFFKFVSTSEFRINPEKPRAPKLSALDAAYVITMMSPVKANFNWLCEHQWAVKSEQIHVQGLSAEMVCNRPRQVVSPSFYLVEAVREAYDAFNEADCPGFNPRSTVFLF